MLICDGFDDAFLGIVERCGQPVISCYSFDGMVAVLMQRDGMEYGDAVEYLEFNVVGAWVGEGTPAILRPMTRAEATEMLDGEDECDGTVTAQ